MSNFISLFCGCGGSSYGYRKSGFSDLLGIDINPISCESFKLNFPSTEIWNRDIKKVTPKEIVSKFNFLKGRISIVA